MKCYLAHPVTDYGGSERQQRALRAIVGEHIDPVNPDGRKHQRGYKKHGMNYFLKLVAECDLLAFMRFPNGSIGAGVAKEIAKARELGICIYDVSTGEMIKIKGEIDGPIMTVEETRAEIARLQSIPYAP
jgi:hypothetical protein